MGADGEVAAVIQQLTVDKKDDQAAGEIHKERPHADGKGLFGDGPVDREHPAPEMHHTFLPAEIEKGVAERHRLTENGRQRGAADAEPEREDEQRIQHGVGCDRENGKIHRGLRVPRSADDAVEAEIQMGDDVACGQDEHIVAGKGQGVFACAEKGEYGIDPHKGHKREQQAYQYIEREGV